MSPTLQLVGISRSTKESTSMFSCRGGCHTPPPWSGVAPADNAKTSHANVPLIYLEKVPRISLPHPWMKNSASAPKFFFPLKFRVHVAFFPTR